MKQPKKLTYAIKRKLSSLGYTPEKIDRLKIRYETDSQYILIDIMTKEEYSIDR